MALITAVHDALVQLLGAAKVSAAAEVLASHAIDKWHASALPEAVVFAEATEDIVRVLQFANERGIPVTTRGAGVGYVGGCVPGQGGIVLSVSRMTRILELNPEDGVAVVQAGVITGDLQDAARKVGWYYPPDPASLRECSLGGNIATNAGGPRCLKYGVTRPYVLGLEVVLADGSVLRCGSRCHKNKTGFDLVGLFVGSEGMLGVVSEATLRLIPHPETRAMLTATFAEFPQAAQAVQRILNSGHLPSALEITDGFTLRAAREYLGPEYVIPVAVGQGEAGDVVVALAHELRHGGALGGVRSSVHGERVPRAQDDSVLPFGHRVVHGVDAVRDLVDRPAVCRHCSSRLPRSSARRRRRRRPCGGPLTQPGAANTASAVSCAASCS